MDINNSPAVFMCAEDLSAHLNGCFEHFIEEVKKVVDAHFASHDLAQEHAQYIFDKFYQASHTLNAIDNEMLDPGLPTKSMRKQFDRSSLYS